MAARPQDTEPQRRRLRSVWLVGRWPILAVLSLSAAVFVAGTETGMRRLFGLAATVTGDAEPVSPSGGSGVDPAEVAGLRTAIQDLTDNISTLEADRDRLKEQVATLERSFHDLTGVVTGSIARATAPRAQVQAPVAAPPLAESRPEPPPARVAAPEKPAVAPPQPVAPGFVLLEPALGLGRMPVTPESSEALWSALPPPRPAPRPQQTAVVTPHQQDADDKPAQRERAAFGIDLGGGNTVEALRALWSAQRAKLPALGNLTPSVVTHPRGGLRLVAGPLPTAAAAAQLCAILSGQKVACQPAHYDGQPLAMR